MLAVEGIVAVGPDHVAGEIQRGETAISKTGVDKLTIRRRRRGCVRVAALLVTRLLAEDLSVPQNLPRRSVDRQYAARSAFVGRRRYEDMVVPHDRRRPGVARTARFSR